MENKGFMENKEFLDLCEFMVLCVLLISKISSFYWKNKIACKHLLSRRNQAFSEGNNKKQDLIKIISRNSSSLVNSWAHHCSCASWIMLPTSFMKLFLMDLMNNVGSLKCEEKEKIAQENKFFAIFNRRINSF